jgi:hypothetical protein
MMTNLIKRRALLLSGISLLSVAFTIPKSTNAQSHSPGAGKGKGKGSDKVHGKPGGGDDGDDHSHDDGDDHGGDDDGDDHGDVSEHGKGGKGPKYRGGRVTVSDSSHGHSLVDRVLRKPLPN